MQPKPSPLLTANTPGRTSDETGERCGSIRRKDFDSVIAGEIERPDACRRTRHTKTDAVGSSLAPYRAVYVDSLLCSAGTIASVRGNRIRKERRQRRA